MNDLSLGELSRLLHARGRIDSDTIELLRSIEWENIKNDEVDDLSDIILKLTAEAIFLYKSPGSIEKKISLKYVGEKLQSSIILEKNVELNGYFRKFLLNVDLI